MVKLRKNMKNINEAKQVGNLYHVCTLDALLYHIIPNNELRASGKYYNKLLNTTEAISFTRDSLFVVPTYTVQNAGILFQFVVDGDKLSEKYKVVPYNGNGDDPRYREKEEVVIGPITNFKSYVKEVRFDIKDIYYLSNHSSELIGDLKEVKTYLGSIPCKRAELPSLDENDWSILFAKTKSKFKVNSLDDLIGLLEKSKGLGNRDDLFFNTIDTADLFFDNFFSFTKKEIETILKEHPSWKKKIYLILPQLLEWGPDRNIKLATSIIENKYVDVNMVDTDGNSLLCNACKNRDSEFIKVLLKNGADANKKNKEGLTPLILYILSDAGDKTPIEDLIKYGAKINEQDNDGNTALHYACLHNCPPSIINYLIKNGADYNIKNNAGAEPIDYLE